MIKFLKNLFSYLSIVVILATMLFFCTGCTTDEGKKPSDNIVFLGDSITSSYDLNKYFPDYPVINSGVWGDRTDQAQSRLESDVYAYSPRKVFILIGINDVGYGRSNDDITSRIEALILDIHKNCPYTDLYLISVYPLNISDFDTWYPPMSENVNDVVDDLNEKLIALSDKLDIVFIDMAPYLKNDSNELKKEYTVEGLHLTDEAYEVISGVLLVYLKE